MSEETLRERVRDLMPQAQQDLTEMVGFRSVHETPYEGNTITQWHPRDFGTLIELDQIRPPESWHMAPRIFETRSTDVVGDFTAIELAVPDPRATARTWATVLDLTVNLDRRQ